jgi:hypothetical protein
MKGLGYIMEAGKYARRFSVVLFCAIVGFVALSGLSMGADVMGNLSTEVNDTISTGISILSLIVVAIVAGLVVKTLGRS